MLAPSRWKIGCGRIADVHVKIAGRRALGAGLALAGQADARAVLDARRDRHLQGALALHRARPWQTRQGLRITRPAPPQVGQVRSTRKNPCWARTLPAPWQVAQVSAARPLSSEPVPAQASQVTRVGTRSAALTPANASAEVDLDRLADVGPGCAPARRAAPPPMNSPNIWSKMSPSPPPAGSRTRRGPPAAALLEGGMAEAVVGGALLLVLQDVVGLVELLEFAPRPACRPGCGPGGAASPACGRPSSDPPRSRRAPRRGWRNNPASPCQPCVPTALSPLPRPPAIAELSHNEIAPGFIEARARSE